MADAIEPVHRWISQRAHEWAHTIHLSPVGSSVIEQAFETAARLPESRSEALQQLASGNPFAKYLADNENSTPIRSILKSLMRRGRISGLLECPYFDLEFWDAHAGFYDKCFLEHARHCERFHFFWIEHLQPRTVDAESQIDQLELSALGELISQFNEGTPWKKIEQTFEDRGRVEYLGYVIFRPTQSFSVGRAAIRFDDRTERELCEAFDGPINEARESFGTIKEEYDGRPILKARHKCQANVLATHIELSTVEFLQQDPHLGACATASLWVATHVAAERFGLNKFSYSTITRQAIYAGNDQPASVSFDPSNLDGGLYPDEIAGAIERTGARALAFQTSEGQSAVAEAMRIRQEVYAFVESGFPVILLVYEDPDGNEDGHAVVAAGHNLPSYETIAAEYRKPASEFLPQAKSNHYLVSTLVPVYYVHDDAYGPFSRVVFSHGIGDEETASQESQGDNQEDEAGATGAPPYPMVRIGGRKSPVESYLNSIIVPVPPMVHGGSTERLNRVLLFFDRMLLPHLESQFGSEVKVLWRSLLMEGAEFKASTVRREFCKEIICWYGTMMLSKYVWLFEFSLIDDQTRWEDQFLAETPREVLGEFLVDATSPDTRCLAYRIGHLGYDYRKNIREPYGAPQSEDEPSIAFPLDSRLWRCPCYTSADGGKGD